MASTSWYLGSLKGYFSGLGVLVELCNWYCSLLFGVFLGLSWPSNRPACASWALQHILLPHLT